MKGPKISAEQHERSLSALPFNKKREGTRQPKEGGKSIPGSRKGQMGLMEYVILTFFIVVVIVVLVFFLLGYHVTQFNLEKRGALSDAALSLAKRISSSPLLTKEGGVFDDGKLTSLTMLGDGCERLEAVFGKDWFAEVTVLDGSNIRTACNQANYPNCNSWSFCTQPGKNSVAFDLPANVHRNIGAVVSTGVLPRTDLAVIKVGIYVR